MTVEHDVAVPCLTVVRPAVPASVGEIRRAVRDFAVANGARGAVLAAIAQAVSEAVTNAVLHAYPRRPGTVRVDIDVEGDELEVVVVDEGRGFTSAPAPGLGLGLALVREGASQFEIRDRVPRGVEVWLRYALPG